MRGKAKFLGRLALANAAIAAVIEVAFADVGLATPWRVALEEFAVSFFITCCISPVCVLVLPRITPRVFARFSFPLNFRKLAILCTGFTRALLEICPVPQCR